MSITIIYTIATLSVIGTSAAVILYFVAQKFKVVEDPRIDDVEERTSQRQLRRLRICRLPCFCRSMCKSR